MILRTINHLREQNHLIILNRDLLNTSKYFEIGLKNT